MQYRDSIVVALTGGIGCGQTTVGNFFEKLGAKVINADQVAKKEIEDNKDIRKQLKKAFGNQIFYRNGRLNRKLLARIAFSDAGKTNRLNRIVHPQMVSRIIDLIEETRASGKYSIVVIDAALIYELNLEHMFDSVVVVASRMSNRIERIKSRDKLSEKEIIDRVNQQIPIEDKIKWANYVIHNNGSLKALEDKTRKVYSKLQELVKKKSERMSGVEFSR